MTTCHSVVIADDVPDLRELIKIGVERQEDFEVIGEAGDGRTALASIEELSPDVLLLDLSMPDMDGLEAIPLVRDRRPDTAIVVLSGFSAGRMSEQASKLGADAYVEKGAPMPKLVEAMRMAVAAHGGDSAPVAVEAPVGGEPPKPAAADRQAEVAELRAELTAAIEDLDQFIHAALHDFAEPLQVILGYSDLLTERFGDKLGDDGGRYIQAVSGGAERMRNLLLAIRAYASIGREQLELTDTDAKAVVDSVVTGNEPLFHERGAEIEVGPLPRLMVQESLLYQLVENLIINALKFNQSDRPEISISSKRENGGWRILVADNGVGIDPAKAPQVFEMFTRLHSCDAPGTGTGLAICKRIVEAHGGEIRVEPNDGGGSVFSFTIPVPDSADG